jgi:hypothetical protein
MKKITKLPNGGELYKNNNGDKHYFLNGIHHREDGPAMEHDGVKSWWINGFLHRTDGPAIEYANGDKYWYINNIKLPCRTQEQFERLMRLKAFW